ncbi:MAG: hypothetical protein U0Y68_10185 [Blastocatellia bacterium]
MGEPAALNSMVISLALIGISLLLGLFTRTGCWGALSLLMLFYCTAAPASSDANYWLVNKTLIEAAAVGVLLVFNTGAMLGLDVLIRRPPVAKNKMPNREDRRQFAE